MKEKRPHVSDIPGPLIDIHFPLPMTWHALDAITKRARLTKPSSVRLYGGEKSYTLANAHLQTIEIGELMKVVLRSKPHSMRSLGQIDVSLLEWFPNYFIILGTIRVLTLDGYNYPGLTRLRVEQKRMPSGEARCKKLKPRMRW
jgi:hypothetical protein